ncbi:hypothetical protein AB0M02_12420 [Actinoplanes sp. NPDC051861]|uniref:hypothetical protein n=1 Tax=Actinoplanes sp. NPDC051861 TaxID=3155170 RepID=UPI0034493980
MTVGSSGWLRRRRHPRLSGTLHIRDTTGHELTVPLRGRAAVLTAGGTGLTGYGEVWAVHTTASSAETALMISYGPDGPADGRESGLCAPGETITLGKVEFTWHPPPVPAVPQQRSGSDFPRNQRSQPAKSLNLRDEPPAAGLRRRLRNMVRGVTEDQGRGLP